ncbi:MAG: hypothetical protein M3011_04675 [Actinomycetota bacterium]|nr:hypothetical protein [Actinomycetota bacterium]
MVEPVRGNAATDWWRSLSTAWRANIGLYGLATVALIALIAQIAIGGGRAPQRVEVASRAPERTAPTSPRLPSTTAPPTTVAPPPPTTPAPATSAAPAPAKTSTPTPPVPLSVDPFVPETTPTVPPLVCRNSTNPDCGPFFWDPSPSNNQPLNVNVSASSPSPDGDVTFTARVTDPDHPVTDNCAQIDYGDGTVDRRPCSFPPCADAHGAWAPPPVLAGDRTFTSTHRYANGSYRATFTFHTDFDPPCPNPYGSAGQDAVTVQKGP